VSGLHVLVSADVHSHVSLDALALDWPTRHSTPPPCTQPKVTMVESRARLHCSQLFCPLTVVLHPVHPLSSSLPVRLSLAHCSPHIIIIIITTLPERDLLRLSCTPTLPD